MVVRHQTTNKNQALAIFNSKHTARRIDSEYRTLAFGNKIYRSTSFERQGVLSEF